MKHLVPRFIIRQDLSGAVRGEIDSISLFLDLTGFTNMTEALISEGKAGAESLSKIINSVFQPLLEIVYANRGLVTTFAGDAFTVLFDKAQGATGARAVVCATRMLEVLHTNPLHRTPWGEFHLQAKIGLGEGPARWSILSGRDKKGYLFRGPAIDFAAAGEHHCNPGELAIPESFPVTETVLSKTVPRKEGDYMVYKPEFTEALPPEMTRAESDETIASLADVPPPELLEAYVGASRLPATSAGEFREICSVFVAFDENVVQTDPFFANVSSLAQRTGGYFNLIDSGDKGGVALVLFGAPVSIGDNRTQALQFAWQLAQREPTARIGVALGRAYTGYVGAELRSTYTALGRVVNLSARLAMIAEPGQILVPSSANRGRDDRFVMASHGSYELKGFADPMAVSVVTDRREASADTGVTGVGRVREREILVESLQILGQGNYAGAVAIEGEAGIGKTQLLSDAWRELEEIAGLIERVDLDAASRVRSLLEPVATHLLRRHGDALAGADSSQRFSDLIDSMISSETPDYLANEIRRAGPAILHLLDIQDESGFANLDAKAQRDRTIEALLAYFSLLAEQRPLLIVVDNSHDIDEGSLEMLDRLLSRDTNLPVMVVFLSRESDFLTRLSIPKADRLSLLPLSATECRAMVETTLGAPPDDTLVSFVVERTEQIPLYIAELLRFLQERGLLYNEEGRLHLRDFDRSTLPASIEALLLSQVDELPTEARRFLPAMAVLGQRFLEPVLVEMVNDSEPESVQEIAPALAQLAEVGLIERASDDEWTFTRGILRDSVYKLQFDTELRDLHGRAAHALERLYPGEIVVPEKKAHHLRLAGDEAASAAFYEKAGDIATDNYENRLAIEHYDWVLALNPDDQAKSLVHMKKAKIFELTGEWDQARSELEWGLGLATVAGADELYHRFFLLLGQISYRKGDTAKARAYLDKALRDPNYTTMDQSKVDIRIELARTYIRDGLFAEAMSRLFEGLDIAKEKGYRIQEGQVYYQLGSIYRQRHRLEDATKALERSRSIFEELNALREGANPLYELGLIQTQSGQLERAEQTFTEILKRYSEIGYKSGLAATMINIGGIMDQQGNFDAAIDMFRRSRHIAEELAEGPAIGYAQFSLGASSYKKREYPQALSYLGEAVEVFRSIDLRTYLGYPFSYLASTHVRMGNAEAAIDQAEQAVDLIDEFGSDPERGRIFLALANLFVRRLPLSDRDRLRLQRIADRTGLKSASAQSFFVHAIKESRSPKYPNTLIPALYDYGRYLLAVSENDGEVREDLKERGVEYVRRAAAEAKEASWFKFLDTVETEYQEHFAPAV